MTIALTGATGFVGRALLDRAQDSEIVVRALARQPQRPRPLVEWVIGDLFNPPRLDQLMDSAETVVHVAGMVNGTPEEFEACNVTGTLNVIEAARRMGVPRIVFVSSLSAREPELSLYGASKARAEKLVMASGLDWTIVRPPAIYGWRDKEMLDLFKAAKWGLVPMPQREGRASYIHVDDLARLLLRIAPAAPGLNGRIYEPDDGREAGWGHREIAHAIGWAVGRRPAIVHLSPDWLKRVARWGQKLTRGKFKLTPDRAGYMAHPDWVVSPQGRVPAQLWKPAIPTREGLKDTAQWYREQGWL
ncbi:NAD(P)-dependent oxidoreductase [Novosphingobium sp. TH158]|uniref:NAD-dependent epimerase/dehydratase family protein n=1 Tax=Novosphingobium sp. TH158 TaxID=2067455 RepID=UPI0020B11299|nr:NAD(P)-dependent oxidoreductase [Novosphingobium sp. TH158]